MTAWLDGALVGDAAAPQATAAAPGPFETMAARRGEVELWDLHLQRIAGAARRLGLPFVPDPKLRAAATGLLLHNGHSDDVLRLALVPAGAFLDGAARKPAAWWYSNSNM